MGAQRSPRRLSAGRVARRCKYGPVANWFRVDDKPNGPKLDLSHGGTDVLFDVLTLAGCTWHAPRGSSA
jgi:hypothetical protein